MPSPIPIVTVSTLYPNAVQPTHGIFVENRLRHLLASGAVRAEVVAPVPYFPFASPRFGIWARYAAPLPPETRNGIAVTHPRYVTLPRIGMVPSPAFLAAAMLPAVARAVRRTGAQLIDAHYLYPDGVAAALVARRLGLPFVMTARGTDVNLIPRYPLPRRMILWACARAAGLITVSQALNDALVALGAPADKVRTLRNGVDLAHFRPLDREAARREFTLEGDGPVIASVGHLVERKGHHLVVEAMTRVPGATLLIAGEGEERPALTALIQRLGLEDRVRLLGALPQSRLPTLYNAADILVLASSREGWANVLLEAMACGTPVVATPIWGNPEVVAAPAAGRLTRERSADAIAEGILALQGDGIDRAATRRFAEGYSWDATTDGQIALFRSIVDADPRE